MSIVVEIDYREKDSGIIEILQAQENFIVEVKNYPLAITSLTNISLLNERQQRIL
ncbi:MAG: hypothetical protein ACK41Q_03550 [Candidatus Brocadia sp.]